MNPAGLTPQHIEQFRRDGYTLAPEFFDKGEVSGFLREIERVSTGQTLAQHDKSRVEMEPRQPPEGTLVRRIYEPCTHYEEFRTLSESGKLLDAVALLIGPDLDFHYSKINMKPPAIGSVVEWHQDLAYYPLTNTDSLAALIYLDDADRANGCLQVIPGRHRGPLMNHTTGGFFQGRVTEPVDESGAVALEGKAGSVIFLHAMTPHSSVTNTSTRPRRTLILSYRAADAYPIFAGEATAAAEGFVRHVRGKKLDLARFNLNEFPIPRQQYRSASLYELQERSRQESV